MLKLKYYYLSKEEKQQLKNDFYQTEFGHNINKRLTRLLVIGIFGVLFSIYLYIDAKNIWNTVYATILLIASLIFIIANYKIRIDKLNTYLVSKKKTH